MLLFCIPSEPPLNGNTMSNNKFYNILLLVFSISCPFPALAFGIGLTPSTIEMDVKPGSHHRQVLNVKNFNRDKPIRLSVSIADWTIDESGQVELMPPSETDRSASDWITFSPSILVLEPNSSSSIVVDITTPLDVMRKGDHRTSIILSTVLPGKKEREGKKGVWNRYQIASLFYANVLPGVGSPLITQAAFKPNAIHSEHSLSFSIHNTGLRHSRIEGSVVLQNEDRETVLKQPFKTVLLDEQLREFNVNFNTSEKALEPGNYSIIFNLKGDGKSIPLSIDHSPVLKVY